MSVAGKIVDVAAASDPESGSYTLVPWGEIAATSRENMSNLSQLAGWLVHLGHPRYVQQGGPAKPGQKLGQSVLQDLFRDLFALVQETAKAHPLWCFPIAAAIAFSESFVGISALIPGTVLLLTMGGVIEASNIPLLPAILGAFLGSMAGDWICYVTWLKYHHHIMHLWPFRHFETQIEKGFDFFRRWEVWAVFIGRFTGPFRSIVPLVAGMSEVRFWHFQLPNAAATAIWAVAILAFPGLIMRTFNSLSVWFGLA
jgi:membrane protein DedA with SNARE-associated domain